MKWIKDNFLFIIIIILIIIILMQKCGGKNINPPTTIIKRDTTYITRIDSITTYVPKWKTKIKHDTIFEIDTAYVLGDYFSTYVYNDTIYLNSDSLILNINDYITQNKIKSRQIKYKHIYPIISTTVTTIQNEREFYYGLGISGDKEGLNNFGPELLLRTKKGSAYGLGVGVNGQLNVTLGFKAYWKIGKK
jgi:hypothetical protein